MRLEPGSLAAAAAGAEQVTVKSHHHQGVDQVGEGLVASGWSVDEADLVEAIEVPGRAFALGVLWHPEEDVRDRVIGALVAAARTGVTTMSLTVLEPATEQVLAEVPRAGAEEIDAAVARARAAFPAWRAVTPGDRATLMRRLADAIESHADDLSVLEARNAGKPIGDARGEIGMVVETFRYYAGAPERLLGQTIPVAGGIDLTFREPLGVVGLIVPWNFPLTIASWKIAPALAAGNTVVLKPAELTPLTALQLESIALESGLPEGVLNVVAGPGSVGRQAAGRAPRRGQDRVHRVDLGGPRDHGRRREHDQARDARAGRQVGQRGVRRRRPGGRRRGRADRHVRQRGPGLLRALAHPGREARRSTGSWRRSRRPSRRCASATRWTRRPRWGR